MTTSSQQIGCVVIAAVVLLVSFGCGESPVDSQPGANTSWVDLVLLGPYNFAPRPIDTIRFRFETSTDYIWFGATYFAGNDLTWIHVPDDLNDSLDRSIDLMFSGRTIGSYSTFQSFPAIMVSLPHSTDPFTLFPYRDSSAGEITVTQYADVGGKITGEFDSRIGVLGSNTIYWIARGQFSVLRRPDNTTDTLGVYKPWDDVSQRWRPNKSLNLRSVQPRV